MMDMEDEDSDGIEENKGESRGKKEEEAALESVAALLSAQVDIPVGEVADQNEFPMMHKLNVSIIPIRKK
jgi:tRNA-binding EMAP/Myf-like protein